jgi:hypothetical protein
MGTAELNRSAKEILIHSWMVTYGSCATPELTLQMQEEIENLWNEPQGSIIFNGTAWTVRFKIEAYCRKDLQPQHIFENTNPKNNYFRIEEHAEGNISFVDGLGCNTGYWLLANLYLGSTTAAHEYGHTLGLPHPTNLDYRGKGFPGIMYPRGTLVDAPFQYDPNAAAGAPGGTMHPMHRRVRQEDIEMLNIEKLAFKNDIAVVGAFSSVWHEVQRG